MPTGEYILSYYWSGSQFIQAAHRTITSRCGRCVTVFLVIALIVMLWVYNTVEENDQIDNDSATATTTETVTATITRTIITTTTASTTSDVDNINIRV